MKHVSALLQTALLCCVIVALAGCASAPKQETVRGDVSLSTAYADVAAGGKLPSPVAGSIVQIGNKDLPAPFNADTIVIATVVRYYYGSEQVLLPVQIVMSGVKPAATLSVGDVVGGDDDVVGTAVSDMVQFNCRSRDLNVYLALSTVDGGFPPQHVDGWYYFGMAPYQYTTLLDFQVLSSSADEIPFWDYPETLMGIYEDASTQAKEEGHNVISNFPNMGLCIPTSLDSLPSSAKAFTDVSEFLTMGNEIQDSLTYSDVWDGVPVKYLFDQQAIEYMKDDYELNTPIWLYVVANKAFNGTLYCHVWDYTTNPPEAVAEYMLDQIRSFIEEQ